MTDICTPYRGKVSRWGVLGLWSAAALIAVSAHAGALAILLKTPPAPMPKDAGAPAMMIDIAAIPEAVNTDQNSLSEQLEDAPDIKAETPPDPEPVEPDPEPVAEEIPPPEPLPEPEPIPEPIEQAEAPPSEVALPTPVAKPPVEKPEVKEVVKEQPKPKRTPPQSQAANRAAAEVEQSNRTATNRVAQQPSAASPRAVTSWQSKLFAHLERHKRYPAAARARRITGTVQYSFNIDSAGNISNVRILRSSGSEILDSALMQLMRAASPAPAPPPGVPNTIRASLDYTLR